jgi:hypothetical protein
MKYTARHIRRFLEQGRIDPALWKIHFPSLLPTQVPTCDECTGYQDKTCPGGQDPVECFLAKAREEGYDKRPKKTNRDPMLGLGVRGREVHGTAKPRDQSKM